MARQTVIYIDDVIGALAPREDLYPSDDLYPGAGTLIIGEVLAPDIPGIANGSLSLSEIIVDGTPIYGKCCSNKFEAELYNVNLDIAKKVIRVYQRTDEGQYSVFKGIIDSSQKDHTGKYRKVVAYDEYYTKKDMDVARWWDSLFYEKEDSYTIKQLRHGLLDYVGISYENVDLLNDTIQIKNPPLFDTMTLDTMLSILCEFSCCFPNMNRSGVMEFVTFSDNIKNISPEAENNDNTKFEDYTTELISGVELYDGGTRVQVFGNTTNSYSIKDNILMLQLDSMTLTTILANLYAYLSLIQYTPSSIKMIQSDWNLKLGDKYVVDGNIGYIMKNNFSGVTMIEQTVDGVATGATLSSVPSVSREYTSLTGKIARVTQTIDSFRTDYENFQEDVASSFEQTAEAISTRVSKGDVVSEINQSADEIRLTAGRLIVETGNFLLDEQGNATTKNGTFRTGERTQLDEDVEGLYVGPEGFDYCWKPLNKWTELGYDWMHCRMASGGFQLIVNDQVIMKLNGSVRASGGLLGPHIFAENIIYHNVCDKGSDYS